MDITLVSWLWLGLGVLLLLSEFLAPSLTAVFFGISALAVGLLNLAGLLQSQVLSLVLWLVGSALLFWSLRSTLLRRHQPDVSREITSEEARAFGSVVEVVVDVTPNDASGRIRYDGTSWPAISRSGTIPKGAKARLLHRDNLAWVVAFAGQELGQSTVETEESTENSPTSSAEDALGKNTSGASI